MQKQFDRVYARVCLDRIEDNMRSMQKNLQPDTSMIGVIKADGYGHGASAVAKAIDPYVVAYAVATVDEAAKLCEAGVQKAILILGAVPKGRYAQCCKRGLRVPLFTMQQARDMSRTAVVLKRNMIVHIALDTGMGRIGLSPTMESARLVREMADLPGLTIEGLFTHFARADEADKGPARGQIQRFSDFLAMLRELGVNPPICHCSNSAGIVDLPEANFNAVRAGITIYGLYPSDQVNRKAVPLSPAMELKSFITYIKTVPAGTEISYGGTFHAERETRVATISAGYADGYPRGLSGKGDVLIRGKRARILGRVCMDQFMVDVTEIPEAAEWDEVTLLGRDGNEEITMEELSWRSGVFLYELPCLIGARVPRVYYSHGKIVGDLTWKERLSLKGEPHF